MTQVAQVLSKVFSSKLWLETIFALDHLSCEEAVVFVYRRVFNEGASRSSSCDELKNFAANNLL